MLLKFRTYRLHIITTTLLLSVFLTSLISAPQVNISSQGNALKKSQGNARKKSNIILILADDVGTGDIPFYWEGPSKVKMPHLKDLANKGVLFKDAHSSPLCAPSRYMLLSGNYPHRGRNIYGTWGLDGSQFTGNQKSIAKSLQEHGYSTGVFGKWHLGAKIPYRSGNRPEKMKLKSVIQHDGHDWSKPLIQGPSDTGFNSSYIATHGVQGPPYSFFRNDYLMTDPSKARWWYPGDYDMPRGTSKIRDGHDGQGDPDWDSSAFDMIVVNETKAFIENHLENRPDDPFFAYVALGTVHIPHSPPDKYLDGSDVKGTHETLHLDMLSVMDKAVGSIVSMIEQNGLANDTIIIFTSDNGGIGLDNGGQCGGENGSPLRGHKGAIWEGGHSVPLIIRHDGKFPTGETRDALVGLSDIYATICELVGIEVPVGSALDSVSFADYITTPEAKQFLRKYFGIYKLQGGKQKQKKWAFAIRGQKVKLVHYPHNNTFEMYDLERDISENNDIIHEQWAQKMFNTLYQELLANSPCPGNSDPSEDFDVQLDGNLAKRNCSWSQSDPSRCSGYSRYKKACRAHGVRLNHIK